MATKRKRKPEPEVLTGRRLERLVTSVLRELARGQAEVDAGRTCATCGRARGCELLGRSLTRAPAPSSRRRVVGGCCDRWQQQQDEAHQESRDTCPVAEPVHTCDP